MERVTGLADILKLFFDRRAALARAGLLALLLGGCASRPSPQETMDARNAGARPSRDTVWTDRFYWGQPPAPARDVQNWEFFFKDCELARRSRRPTRSEWECRGP